MKKCLRCGELIHDEDLFCTYCGTKQEGQNQENNSLLLKYSGYLDNEALFKVAWAKEKGLIKSDYPGEAEAIYQMLALRGHFESMYRYAMVLLAKNPPDRENAGKWLHLAARQGHIPSRNYLDTVFEPTPGKWADRPEAPMSAEPRIPEPASGRTDSRPGTGEILSGAEIFSRMKDAVVEIRSTSDGRNLSCASGFLVSSNGFVLTNAHAVLDEQGNVYRTVRVKTETAEYEAKPLAIGQPTNGNRDAVDLALLFVKELIGRKPAVLGDSDTCENGQKDYLIGNSLGSGIRITSGIISDKHRTVKGLSYPYIMTDAAANHGNSGGPLLNEYGETVGVLVSGIESAEGMNYAIPVNVVKSFLSYVLKKTNLSYSQYAELAPLYCENENMSLNWGNILAGIQIALDVVALIISIL